MAEDANDTNFEEQESPPPQPTGTAPEKLAVRPLRPDHVPSWDMREKKADEQPVAC